MMRLAILRRLAHLFLLSHAGAIVSSAAAAACETNQETVPQTANVRLDDFRQRTFDSAPGPGDYGIVSYYASLSRKADDLRLQQLFSRVAKDQFFRIAWIDTKLRRNWAADFDQETVRSMGRNIAAEICRIDEENLLWLKADLEKGGWYKISRAGQQADFAAWLLVQHSDEDNDFQKMVLAMLEPLIATGETSKSNYGMLFDRIAVHDKRPQKYGSQGRCSAPHLWSPEQIEKPDEIEKRRADVGLPPFSEYIAQMSASCP